MALSQNGANYVNQAELQRRDRMLGAALDDLASQVQAVRSQGNLGQSGPPSAPHPPITLSVSSSGGFATATITYTGAPSGLQYVLQYSTTPTFKNPVPVDLGISPSFHGYLKGLTLYFRAAAKLAASGLSAWTYFGSSSNPTPTTF